MRQYDTITLHKQQNNQKQLTQSFIGLGVNMDINGNASHRILEVSELNAQIKSILEHTFFDVYVRGEISNLTVHTSGHIYLSIKDAQSSVRCVMFKGNARHLNITLAVGQNVEISGSISVYAPKGEYQILCKSIALAGRGELFKAYEALKAKLQAKGYFDSAHKKPLPRFPKRVALLTSATGAAKEDMLKVAHKRWEHIHITLFNTIVQGVEAKDSIVANIALCDSFYGTVKGFDVMIVGRGGGSAEDMWAFNEECVADAIFQARTPIISAVGHEVDVFISDFVADVRAPTPSAAMEMLLPDKNEYMQKCDEMAYLLQSTFEKHFQHKNEILKQMFEYFSLYNFHAQYITKADSINAIQIMLKQKLDTFLQEKQTIYENLTLPLKLGYEKRMREAINQYEALLEAYKAHNLASLCERGFVQLSKDEKATTLAQIQNGDIFCVQDIHDSILAQCVKKY